MKAGDIRDDYYVLSGKLSDISRNLCFAGIAVIWALRLGNAAESGIVFSEKLLLPLAIFVLSLTLDFIQYAWSTAATGIMNKIYWNRYKDDETSVEFPTWLNVVTSVIFIVKLIASFAGQAILLFYIWKLL